MSRLRSELWLYMDRNALDVTHGLSTPPYPRSLRKLHSRKAKQQGIGKGGQGECEKLAEGEAGSRK